MMYWSDDPLDGANGGIRRANLDGSGETVLIRGLPGPRGVYLDVVGGKMYWDDAVLGEILRANLDGSGQEVSFAIGSPLWDICNRGDLLVGRGPRMER
jgi:hypothetical protein